jgi:2Fe-2S ferredoxin
MVKITFVEQNGRQRTVDARDGETLLDVAHRHNIDIEGACEGIMACSTCHLIIADDWFDRLPALSEEEEDMLDITVGLAETSRLGCQLTVTADLDGLVVSLPASTNNMML